MVTVAPAIVGARRKARFSELDEARALVKAFGTLADTPVWVPVEYGGRIIGEVRGDRQNQRSLFKPAYRANGFPYKNYDDAINNLTQEFRWAGNHTKMFPPGAVGNNWYDAWCTDGNPSKGDYSGTAKTARQFLNTTTGAMYSGPAVSPKTKYLLRWSTMIPEGQQQQLLFYDRVLSYDGCTMNGALQSMTNTLAATRYISTGDPGLQLFVAADTVHAATASNLSAVNYTNNAGTSGQLVTTSPTLTLVPSLVAPTSSLGARGAVEAPGIATQNLLHVPLAAGDTGIRSIQSFTTSASRTGTVSFMLHFPLMLALSEGSAIGTINDYSFVGGLEGIGKRIYDDACLSILVLLRGASVASQIHGWLEVGWVN